MDGRERDAGFGKKEKNARMREKQRMKEKGKEKEKKERKKEGKNERRKEWKRKGRMAGRASPAAAGDGRKWPEMAGQSSKSKPLVGCKCSSFEKFGVLKMVFRRMKLYLIGKSTPRRKRWRSWWWLRWCRLWWK